MHVELFNCIYVCVSCECHAYTGQKASDALKLVIEAVCRMWVLGIDPYPSGSAVSALNLCAISPALYFSCTYPCLQIFQIILLPEDMTCPLEMNKCIYWLLLVVGFCFVLRQGLTL